jgi:hypothetical protein
MSHICDIHDAVGQDCYLHHFHLFHEGEYDVCQFCRVHQIFYCIPDILNFAVRRAYVGIWVEFFDLSYPWLAFLPKSFVPLCFMDLATVFDDYAFYT